MTGKSEQCSKCRLLSICLCFYFLFNQLNYVWNNTALNFRMIVLPLVHSLKQHKLINREELQKDIRNSIHTQTKNKPSIQAEMCLCRASFKRDLFFPLPSLQKDVMQ